MIRIVFCLTLALLLGQVGLGGAANAQDPALQTILAVNSKQPQSRDAAAAWRNVAQWNVSRLPEVMDAMDRANPVAMNWLRSAVDGMLQHSEAELPIAVLRAIAEDTSRRLPSRKVALEMLETANPELVAAMIPGFLEDPAAEFRRPAVAELMVKAQSIQGDPETKKAILLQAFAAARSEDQVLAIAKSLEELGESVDLPQHFGYIMSWHVLGPFDNKEMAGFDQAFPVESLSLDDFTNDDQPPAERDYSGKEGPIRWKSQQAKAESGEIDLNESLGKLTEVVAYGAKLFHSADDRQAELRLRMQNPFKIWLNGELIQAQRVGHTGNSFDQYRLPIQLLKGPNLIVIKSCQPIPPQENEFFDTWHWSVRVCDATGTAILESR